MDATLAAPAAPARRRGWRVFFFGLAVRLAGVALLWAGDGHDGTFRKALVVLGVALSIGGIGALRYLLLADLVSKLHRSGYARRPPPPHNPPVRRAGGEGDL